jgi:hypothetical protein
MPRAILRHGSRVEEKTEEGNSEREREGVREVSVWFSRARDVEERAGMDATRWPVSEPVATIAPAV